jgi:hypothetical protein
VMALHLALDILTVALAVASGLCVWWLLGYALWSILQTLRGER